MITNRRKQAALERLAEEDTDSLKTDQEFEDEATFEMPKKVNKADDSDDGSPQ